VVAHAELIRALVVEGRALADVLRAAGVAGRRAEIGARDALFHALGRIARAAGIEPPEQPSREND
jgi:hypothetical protein